MLSPRTCVVMPKELPPEDERLTSEAASALAQSFDPAHSFGLEPVDALSLEDVRRFLVQHVTRLLDRNRALLMHILYRVDVAERDVTRAFATCTPEELPGRLADLLIERQLQKLRTRRTYRDSGSI